jgi:hypothetical protein
MTKGKLIGTCKTCGTEIVQHSNDGVFDAGECEDCERRRYETQPELLALTEEYRDACSCHISLLKDDLAGEHEFSGDASDIRAQIEHWKAVQKNCDTIITKAHGNAA